MMQGLQWIRNVTEIMFFFFRFAKDKGQSPFFNEKVAISKVIIQIGELKNMCDCNSGKCFESNVVKCRLKLIFNKSVTFESYETTVINFIVKKFILTNFYLKD